MTPEYQYIVNGRMLAFIRTRPGYCDRGRYDSNIEVGMWRSDADWWPRYYFDLERAKAETLEYLRIKHRDGKFVDKSITTVEGGEWIVSPDGERPDYSPPHENLVGGEER